jgi:drug/metabolite transporter (DMT)-like permease
MIAEKQLTTYAALTLAVLFWGLSFIATKIALVSFTPFCLIFARFSTAALFFACLLFRRGAPPINKATFKKLFLLALFQPGLYFFFETYGLTFTGATKTSLIIATIPILVLIFSAIFLKERVRLINAAGIVMSLLGVALLVFGEKEAAISSGVLWGDFLIFGAVLSATIYIIFARYLGQTISAVQITGLQVIFGTLLFLPFFLWDLNSMNWQQITIEAIIAVICLSLFATIGAFLCYNFALSRIGAARASVFINVIPVITACGAWSVLGETLTALQIIGAIVVILAVYLANYRLQS